MKLENLLEDIKEEDLDIEKIKYWWGRYKTHDETFLNFLKSLKSKIKIKYPKVLYRGLYIDKSNYNPTKLKNGLKSWTKNISYAKKYASSGKYVKNPLMVLFIWNNPDNSKIYIDGNDLNKIIKKDILDQNEYIADSSSAKIIKEYKKEKFIIVELEG
jgi:hypothetical protein